MLIDISEFIRDSTRVIYRISDTVKIDDFDSNINFIENPTFNALFTKVDDDIYLNLEILVKYTDKCDRCLTTVNVEKTIEHQSQLVYNYPDEDEIDEDYIIIKSNSIDIKEIITELVILTFMKKTICDEACKGLCSQCGKDLNKGNCDCEKPVGDLRFAVLENLILDEEE